MNDLLYFSKNNFSQLSYLADEIIAKKWPAKENEQDLFNFIFECFNFLRVFFLIGKNNFDFTSPFNQVLELNFFCLR